RMADGLSPQIEGEVHGIVIEIPGGLTIPINVVSIKNLDVDVLLGRPFLERGRVIVDSFRGLYNILWNGYWAVARGADGLVSPQRKLTANEQEDWEYGRPPRFAVDP